MYRDRFVKPELVKSVLYVRSTDMRYLFQSCKIGQFFLIHFVYDVFLEFLYFSKILDFIRFVRSFRSLKKYLLKQYVLFLSSAFYSHYFTLARALSVKSDFELMTALINAKLSISVMLMNEPIFLR